MQTAEICGNENYLKLLKKKLLFTIWYAKKVKGEFLYGNTLGDDKKPVYDSKTYSQQLTLNFLTGSGMF